MHFRRVRGILDLLKKIHYSVYNNSYWLTVSIYSQLKATVRRTTGFTYRKRTPATGATTGQLSEAYKIKKGENWAKVGVVVHSYFVYLLNYLSINYYIITFFFLVQNQLMFDSISELQKKVTYNPFDSFLPRTWRVTWATRESWWYEHTLC